MNLLHIGHMLASSSKHTAPFSVIQGKNNIKNVVGDSSLAFP